MFRTNDRVLTAMQGDDLIDVFVTFYRCAPGVRTADAVWDTDLYAGHCVPHFVQPPSEHGAVHHHGRPHGDALRNIRYVNLINVHDSLILLRRRLFFCDLCRWYHILHNLVTFYHEISFL